MKAWLVVVCLVIGATSTEITQKAVCYLKQDAISKNAAMGYYNTIDNFELTKAPFQLEAGTIDVFAAKDDAFPYNLITNPLTVQLPSDFTVPASATDLTDVVQLLLTIPGAAAAPLDVEIQYDEAVNTLSVTVTSACGPERTEQPLKIVDAPLPVADMKTWLWKFTMVDEGVDTGMQLQLKVGSDLATPVIDLAVALDKDCRAKLDGEKGKQLVMLNIADADKVKIVLGAADAGPKIDGFVDNNGITPVVDYAHLKAVVAHIATVDTLAPSSVSSFVYVPNDVCYDITNYKTNAPKGTDWITVNPLGDQACPTREVDCAILTGSGDMCSFLTDYCTTCSGKCVANKYKRCAVENVIANAGVSEKVMVGATEVTASNKAEYNKLYLGEKITFSCIDAEQMIPYSDQIGVLDDRTKVPLSCVINENGDVSDLDALSLTCRAKCKTFTVDESTEYTLNLDDGYPEDYPIPVKCKAGYGQSDGGTGGESANCVNDGSYDDFKCYQCPITTPEAEAHATYVSADDKITVVTDAIVPQKTVFFKCDAGYSLRKTGETGVYAGGRTEVEVKCLYLQRQDTAALTVDAKAIDASDFQCIKDCPIVTAGNAPTTLKYEFGGEVTTLASVPQSGTYTLSCLDSAFKQQFGEAQTIACSDGSSDDLEVKECKQSCSIGNFVDSDRNLYKKETLADNWATDSVVVNANTEVAYGTPLSIFCKSGTHPVYEESPDIARQVFECSDTVYNFDQANGDVGFKADAVNDCYDECSLKSNLDDYQETFVVVVGPSAAEGAKLKDLKMLPGTTVKVTCADPDKVIQDEGNIAMEWKCLTNAGGSDQISLKPCRASCVLADLTLPTTNTRLTDGGDTQTSKVEFAKHPTISCESDKYKIFQDLADTNNKELKCGVASGVAAFLQLKDGTTDIYEEFDQTLRTNFACVPIAQFTTDQKTATGPQSMTLSIELDGSRDDTLVIEKVVLNGVKPDGTDPELLCEITNLAKPTNVFTCDYTESDPTKVSAPVTNIKATVTYTTPANLGAAESPDTLAEALVGPPAVIAANIESLSAVGTTKLKLNWNLVSLQSLFESLVKATYVIKFHVSVVQTADKNQEVKDLGSYTYDELKAKPEYDLGTELSPSTEYSLQIMTALEGYTAGGKYTQEFRTGRAPKTLSSTATAFDKATITVTAADNTAAGDIHLSYTVTDVTAEPDVVIQTENKAFTFTAGVATIDLVGLSALTKYNIKVIMYETDDNSAPSEEVPLDFVQGPEPPIFVKTTWVITDVSIEVDWTPIQDYTYDVKIFVKDAAEKESHTITATSTDILKHKFEGLTAGADYTIKMVSKTVVDGVSVESVPSVDVDAKTYRCNLQELINHGDKLMLNNAEVTTPYFAVDNSVEYEVSCRADWEAPKTETHGMKTKCLDGGWSAHDDCIKITCTAFGGAWIANVVALDGPVDVHTEVDVVCDANYKNMGGTKVKCVKDTQFANVGVENKDPDCQPECTGVDPAWAGANVEVATGTQFPVVKGEEVSVVCKTGYSNQGGSVYTCVEITTYTAKADDNGDPNPANCVIECNSLPDEAEWKNVYLKKPTTLPVIAGATITVACNPGFRMVEETGGTEFTCVEVTTFNPVVATKAKPNCVLGKCTNLPKSWTDGHLSTTSDFKDPEVKGNDVIEVTCAENYENTGDSKIRCNYGTDFTSTNEPKCVEEACPDFEAALDANAELEATAGKKEKGEKYVFGDKVDFACTGDNKLVGNAHLECLKGKVWSSALPSCLAINTNCAKFTVENGNLDNKEPYTGTDAEKQEVGVSCNLGYSIAGTYPRVCGTAGWEQAAPTCAKPEEGNCLTPTRPKNGNLLAFSGQDGIKMVKGTTVKATCATNYAPVKGAILESECQADGTWKDLQTDENPTAAFAPCALTADPSSQILSAEVTLSAPYCRTIKEEGYAKTALEDKLNGLSIPCLATNCEVENFVCAGDDTTTSVSFDIVKSKGFDVKDELTAAKQKIEEAVNAGTFTLTVDDSAKRRRKRATSLTADSIKTSTAITCDAGAVVTVGGDKCLECPIGYKQEGDACVACPVGSYNGVTKASQCTACADKMLTYGVGSTNAAQCLTLCTVPTITSGSLSVGAGFRVETTHELTLKCDDGYDPSVETAFKCSAYDAETITCDEAGGLSGGAIAGIVIAVIVVLIIIIIVIVLLTKRRSSSDAGSSKKYSPRDEEKQNEPAPEPSPEKPATVELTAVVTENEYDTIPDDQPADVAANGENVSMASQEKKIDMGDDDAPDVVIDNKAATVDEQV